MKTLLHHFSGYIKEGTRISREGFLKLINLSEGDSYLARIVKSFKFSEVEKEGGEVFLID